jgi:asparagine synthase (glutamine-hydrolysing)
MCGISGFIAPGGVAGGVLRRMTDVIRHRGPDDEGFALWSNDNVSNHNSQNTMPEIYGGEDTPHNMKLPVLDTQENKSATLGLGHRRLSILDLSARGHQPMRDSGGRYWIVYNGEIYNYIELREELVALGYNFVSQSDTEVILAAYQEWGADCLSRFNGMWAFALFDTQSQSLFLARDRFGVKPLYYWAAPDGALYFASEIKQFTAHPDWRARLNTQRVYDFLVWSALDHTQETLFEGVYHLRAGHYAVLDMTMAFPPDAAIAVVQWYQLRGQCYQGSFEEAAAKFQDLLRQSVQLRLRSDVPVGSCLSGGLDSSSIVCLMNGLLAEQGAGALQKTFSAIADVARVDERKWIEAVITAGGIEAHYTQPRFEALFNDLERLTWHQDEPFGSTSIFAQWHVFKLAAEQNVRVMLDGQGADEQLAGYHMFFGALLSSLVRRGRFLAAITEARAIHRIHGHSYLWIAAQTGSALLPLWLKNPLRKMLRRMEKAPAWLDIKQLHAKAGEPHHGSARDVRSLCHAQMTATNLQMLLHWEDRDSMAHSIESRVPFLDYRLAEFVMGLPDHYKIKGGVTKRILRAGMSGIIPDVIRDRIDKIGFATPEEEWLRTHPDLFRDRLKQAAARTNGIIKPEAALAILEEIIDGKRPFSFVIWRIISFGVWMELFSVEAVTQTKCPCNI